MSLAEKKKPAETVLEITSLFTGADSSTRPTKPENGPYRNAWKTYDSFIQKSLMELEMSNPSERLIGSTRKGELEDLLRFVGVQTNAEICDDITGDAAFIYAYEWTLLYVPELLGTKKFAYIVALLAIWISHESHGAVGGDVTKLKIFSGYGLDVKSLLAEFETPEMPGLTVHHWIGSLLCNYAENATDIEDPACVDFFRRLTMTGEMDKVLHHRAFAAYMQGGIILIAKAKGIKITPRRRAKIDAYSKAGIVYHDLGNLRRHASEQTATNVILATKGTNTTPEMLLLYARNVYMSLIEDKEKDPEFTALATHLLACFSAGPNFLSHYMKYNAAVMWATENGWGKKVIPAYRRRETAVRSVAQEVFQKAMKAKPGNMKDAHPSENCPVHFEIPVPLVALYDELYFSVMGKYGFGNEVCNCRDQLQETKTA